MAWKECCRVSSRREFVELASVEGACMTTLCQRFGIARKTGYKWLVRYCAAGLSDLEDRSRRPGRFRALTPPAVEARVLDARDRHPAWGGRKLHHWLARQGLRDVPAPSTITATAPPRPPRRRSGGAPAEARLGPVRAPRAERPLADGFQRRILFDKWRHVLSLDDHRRPLAVCPRGGACGDQRQETVRRELTDVFRRYGLPRRMLMDNGSPWGVTHTPGPSRT